MEKIEVIFPLAIPKKHSIRFSNNSQEAAVSDIYIKRSAFGRSEPPKKVKITIEEVV